MLSGMKRSGLKIIVLTKVTWPDDHFVQGCPYAAGIAFPLAV